jgi:hypothetical protein
MYLWNAKSPSRLGFFRPNDSFDDGIYGLAADPVAVDPETLLLGIGALGLALFLLGGTVTPKIRRAEAGRLKRRRERISKRIQELEA